MYIDLGVTQSYISAVSRYRPVAMSSTHCLNMRLMNVELQLDQTQGGGGDAGDIGDL